MHLPVGLGGRLLKVKFVPDVGTVAGKSIRHLRLQFSHFALVGYMAMGEMQDRGTTENAQPSTYT